MRKSIIKPRIRFSSFNDDWMINEIGKIFQISAGGDINKKNVSQIKDSKFQYPIYANAEKEKGLYGYSDIYKISNLSITVAGRGVNIGIAHARLHKYYPIVRLLVLIPLIEMDVFFFEYQINRLNLFKESTGVPQLTAPQISRYEISFPSFPEQQKIASFLTTVDEKIQLLKKQQTLLELYKKGVMQKIFSRELRFKDENGKDFQKWEEVSLNSVVVINKGKQLNKELLDESGMYPCLNGGIGPSGYTTEYNTFENTIAISEGGNSCGYVNYVREKFWCGGHCYALAVSSQSTFDLYLYQFLKFKQPEIMALRVGSGLPNIQKKDLMKFEVMLPELREQQKIASFLITIDEKIDHCKEQIRLTEEWKKGLLQQMFV